MVVTSLGGWFSVKNLKKSPVFMVKNGQEKAPPRRWGFFMFQSVLFFLIFVVFCPSFAFLPLFLLHPQA